MNGMGSHEWRGDKYPQDALETRVAELEAELAKWKLAAKKNANAIWDMNSGALSWKDVLDVKGWPGGIAEMYALAQKVEYPYFLWNGRVYSVATNEEGNNNTPYTAKDIR